jgi:glycosyltransferase involved in cell wall biosynthesis
LAKGKYILVLQADDRLMDREALERVHRLLEKEEHDIYSFPVIREEGLHGRFAYKPLKILWWHHFKTIFPHQGTFVSRRVFERIGGFREELTIAFDYDFFYRALQARCTVKFGKEPAAVMGGTGISSNSSLLGLRLEEECLVQCLNETNRAWKTAQNCFRAIYLPYKTRFAPLWKAHSRKCSMICAH